MHLIAATMAALVLLHSCQAEVNLRFNYNRVWLNDNITVSCLLNPTSSLKDVKAIRFWGSLTDVNEEFNAQNPKCGDANAKFDVTKNALGNRMSLDYSKQAVTLLWNNAAMQDSDTYQCALTPCSTEKEERSAAPAVLTVVTPPTTPEILDPKANITVYENQQVNLNVTCNANAGYPDGLVDIKIKMGTSQSTTTHYTDSTGKFHGTSIRSSSFDRSGPTFISCESYNSASGEKKNLTDTRYVTVHYPPTDNRFISENSNNQITSTVGKYYLYADAPLDVTVTCVPDAYPTPNITLSTLFALDNTVEYINNKQARIRVSNSQLGGRSKTELQLQCNSTYQSDLPDSPVPVVKSSILQVTVYASDGASLAKISIAAYLATLIVLLKTFQ